MRILIVTILLFVYFSSFSQIDKILYKKRIFIANSDTTLFLQFEPRSKKLTKAGKSYLNSFYTTYKDSLLSRDTYYFQLDEDKSVSERLVFKRAKNTAKYISKNYSIDQNIIKFRYSKVITRSCDGYIRSSK